MEVEIGKGSDALDRRPQLAAALAEARKRKCSIIVAKLDRLCCDVSVNEDKAPHFHTDASRHHASRT